MQHLSIPRTARRLLCGSASRAVAAATMLGCLSAAPAWAITIYNTTTNTLLFEDDFEGAPSVSSLAFPDHTGDHDPDNGALAGSWDIVEPDITDPGDRQGNIQVTDRPGVFDPVSEPFQDPGPFQGTKYLRVGREDSGSNPAAYATFSEIANSGETIRFESMFATNHSGNSSNAGFYLVGLVDGNPDALITTTSFTPGGTVRNHNGLGTSSSGLTYNPEGWNRIMIEYTVGADDFTVTVNGNSEVLNTRAWAGGFGQPVENIKSVRLQGHHGGVQIYADAVPEPHSILLAMIGVVSMVVGISRFR